MNAQSLGYNDLGVLFSGNDNNGTSITNDGEKRLIILLMIKDFMIIIKK